ERNPEALRIANGDISAEFARRFEQCERKNIGRDNNERASVMRTADEISIIIDRAIGGGILHEPAERRACLRLAFLGSQVRHGRFVLWRTRRMRYFKIEFAKIAHDHLDSERLRPRLDHGNRLRMTIIRDE